MKPTPTFFLITIASTGLFHVPLLQAQIGSTPKRPEVISIDLRRFQEPSDKDKHEVEQWLLELDLVPMVADRVAFTATGTFFFAGTGKEKQITNLRQYAIGWSIDNQTDRERLLVTNQRLLNPKIIDQDKWRLMQSDTSRLDRLRIQSEYHEANGSERYPAGPKTRLKTSLETANTFFPTRAATSTPVSCWAGQAMDRSKPMVTIDKLRGIQIIGNHKVAMFEYRPADYYLFFVSLAFLNGSPVQCDAWRTFRQPERSFEKSHIQSRSESEQKDLRSNAQHVATTQSIWKKLGPHAVPTWIHASTLNEVYDVELTAEIEWFVNEQVDARVFSIQTLQQLGPFAVAREQN